MEGNTPYAIIATGPSNADPGVFKDLEIEFAKYCNAIIIVQMVDG